MFLLFCETHPIGIGLLVILGIAFITTIICWIIDSIAKNRLLMEIGAVIYAGIIAIIVVICTMLSVIGVAWITGVIIKQIFC